MEVNKPSTGNALGEGEPTSRLALSFCAGQTVAQKQQGHRFKNKIRAYEMDNNCPPEKHLEEPEECA